MAEKQAETSTKSRVSERQRFHYIGFDVYPGDPKDLFQSESEKESLIAKVRAKRTQHNRLRENNALVEDRVSLLDRIALTVAAVALIFSLILPFYTVYNEKVETAQATASNFSESGEELITAQTAKKKVSREYREVSGLGSLGFIGNVMSGGPILMLTGVVMLLYTLACLGTGGYVLYHLFGVKGNADEVALRLKKVLQYGWVPLLLFVLALLISFVGSGYGGAGASAYSSLGDSFNVGVFLSTLSWGIWVSMTAGVILAAKGIEI